MSQSSRHHRFFSNHQLLATLFTSLSLLTLPMACGESKDPDPEPNNHQDPDDNNDDKTTDGHADEDDAGKPDAGPSKPDATDDENDEDAGTSNTGDDTAEAEPDGGVTADDGDGGGEAPPDNPGLPPVGADAEDSWTVLVYMNGDNDLEYFALQDFIEMVNVPGNPKLNVLVQLDRAEDGASPGYSSDDLGPAGNFTSAKRFRVNSQDTSILDDLGEVNMGSEDTLADFVEWGVREGNTGHYGLVFWDHGGGWDLFGPDDSDDHDGLDLPEIAGGIASGLEAAGRDVKLDFVGFDACLMATLETAQAVRPYASLLLASQELEPGSGWDWTALEVLSADPSASGQDFGKEIIERYGPHVGETRNATLSMVDLDKLGEVTDALGALASALDDVDPQLVGQVRARTPEFAGGHDKGLIDLSQFAEDLGAADDALTDATQGLVTALDAVVLSDYHGPDAGYSHGLSLYFPLTPATYEASYAQLTGITEWQSYLNDYLNAGEDLPDLAGFTNPDKIGELAYDSNTGFLYLTGDLAEGTAEQLVSATLNFGLAMDDGYLFLGSNDGVWDTDQAQGAWDLTALIGSQGELVAPFYYYEQYSSESDTYSFTTPVLYEGQYNLYYQLVLNSDFELISETYYGEIEGAIGEVEIPQSGTLQPILPAMDNTGESAQVPLDTVFDLSQGGISFSFEAMEAGTSVIMALEIADFGGNTDMVLNVGEL